MKMANLLWIASQPQNIIRDTKVAERSWAARATARALIAGDRQHFVRVAADRTTATHHRDKQVVRIPTLFSASSKTTA